MTDLARAFPDIKIILDHFGGPLELAHTRENRMRFFKNGIKILLSWQRENVYAKLGGVNMDVNGFAWHERKMPPSSQELRRY